MNLGELPPTIVGFLKEIYLLFPKPALLAAGRLRSQTGSWLEQNATQNNACHAEVDDQTGNVDERGNERS